MTPEELTALVERGDESALIEGLSSLNEQQRGKLSTAAQQLLRRSNKEDVDPSFAYCAELAVLGAGPLSAAMKLEEVVGTDAGRVLADRRPDWLVKWIDGMLVDAFWRIEWETLAPLINSGCVSPSRCQGVVKAMVCGLYFKHWHNHGETSIADDLIGHPELLDSIYSLFDVETHAFHSYAGDPDYVGSSWPRTIIDLCEKEHLDRSRILAKTVGALSQDLKPQSIHGIARLHDDLSPTDDERKTDRFYLTRGVIGLTFYPIKG